MALGDASAKREHVEAEENPLSKKRKLGDGVWTNLDLILSIQNKQLPPQRKIELAFDFIAKDQKIVNDTPNSVSVSRFVLFLSDWIQSVLISDQNKKSSELSDLCLDFRCWAILRFCVDSSSVGVSPNLLRAVTRFARHALNGNTGYSVQLIDQASECLSVILASNSRAFYNVGVELWVSCAMEIVSLLRKIVSDDNQVACSTAPLSKMSRLVVEHFSNFLRFHPNPKNVFRVFVDRLLEPLLEFLVLLHLKGDTGKSEHVGSLVKMVEEVLSNGLFHPAHIGGFSSSRSSVRQEVRESKGINESYHRHFFRRLEKIIAEKKAVALCGLGYLLRMFVSRVKVQKLASLSFKHEEALREGAEASEEAHATSKPLFEMFVQFMEPLLLECKRFTDTSLSELGGVSEIQLVEVHGMLRSVNETLASFFQERIYVRSEDTSEGTHCSFLTEVCGNIISIADRILVIWLSDGGVQKILALIAKEVLVALGYMLEIEYKAVGDDLAILWLLLLSFSALSVTITDKKLFALINAEISKLGCQVINVYGELRQVHIPILALCKAIRFLTASDAAGIVEHAKCVYASTLSSDICLESVTSLLWSHEVQLAASNAVKSIPEGQASGCIQHLTVDFMDSLEWMRLGSVGVNEEELGEAENLKINLPKLNLQAELLGRFLSEIYTILLDSLNVTATNCVFIGNSMKDLMKNIRSNFRYLVQDQPDRVDEFCFSVMGCKLTKDITAEHDSHLWINPKSMTWILVFYFRIYVSCRSLYRQSISLMPPDSSQKASAAMGSSFIISCGVDWKEMSDCVDEGYFSWIVKSSISLVDVINSLSEHFLSNNPGRYAPLVYVLHIMALQRLVDLNRHIKSYEFFHERDASLVQMESDTHMQKMCKKWKRLLKVSRKEAAELTNFMIGYMPPLVSRGWLVNKDDTSEVRDIFLVYEDEWDLGACSLIEKSLPVAIWWLLCQNVDVWCTHATKKALKQFCSRLLHYSLPCRSSSGSTRYSDQLAKYQLLRSRKVTMHLISWEFLSNTVSYEQKVLLKLFPAKFCFVLKNTILPLLSSDLASNADLGSAAEWSEVMNVLDKKPVVFIDSGDALHDLSSPPPSDTVFLKICDSKHKRQLVSSLDMALEACESLLKLLGQMLHVHFDAKSFITYTTCILNLEKHLVSKLSSYHGDSSTYVPFEILRLFMSCRRTLKCLLMASIEDSEVRQSLFSSVLFSNSLSMSWAVKSVYQVVGLPCAVFEKKYANQVNELIFSLMENTSYVFFAVISGQTTAAMPLLLDDTEPETESMMIHVSEILSEQIEDILFILKSDKLALIKEDGISVLNWNTISSVISCSQGFLWGFTSAIENMYKDCSSENIQPSRSICHLVSKLISFMGVFEEFINLCLNILLTDHGQENKISYNKCDFADLICKDGPSSSNVLNMDISMGGIVTDKCGGRGDKNTEQALENDCTKISKAKKRKSSSSHTNYAGTVLHGFQKFDLSKTQHPKETLLQSLLRGENPQIAFVLKQVFVSCAAILQLKCLPWFHRATESQISCSSSELSSTYILLSTSRVVLHEMAKMSDRPEPYTFFWLSGILNYLEVLGSYFNMTNPDLSKNLYAELIDIHLKAIGKCISLQGKAATLSSHETNSNTKMLEMQGGLSELEMIVPDHREYNINAFKVRLRKSFQMLVKRPLRLHLLTAVKALERALVGVHKSSNMIYEITTGSLGGGMVSSYVAAGVDCLDLVLEIIPGTKQVIRRNISSLVSALFNIVLHLQSSSIFFLEKRPLNETELNPHPGLVILMCVGVLTKVVGGHSYKMSPHHISQCLHLPTALFHKFRRLNASSMECDNWAFSTNQDARQLKGKLCHCVDNQFSVDLYAACCRLLSTTLRHHKWEAGRCVALVEDSVSILLSSLEMVDVNFAWGLQEAVKCASFFRRIYEEIRHQKDIFARHAAHFLSGYISTCSGYGPLKLGIKKEVDEALRPGVYALIDICTPTDLQRLHTVLGEGPCRSTLANLQQDYRLNFQYEGKI